MATHDMSSFIQLINHRVNFVHYWWVQLNDEFIDWSIHDDMVMQ